MPRFSIALSCRCAPVSPRFRPRPRFDTPSVARCRRGTQRSGTLRMEGGHAKHMRHKGLERLGRSDWWRPSQPRSITIWTGLCWICSCYQRVPSAPLQEGALPSGLCCLQNQGLDSLGGLGRSSPGGRRKHQWPGSSCSEVVLSRSIDSVGILTQGRAWVHAHGWLCGASLAALPKGQAVTA